MRGIWPEPGIPRHKRLLRGRSQLRLHVSALARDGHGRFTRLVEKGEGSCDVSEAVADSSRLVRGFWLLVSSERISLQYNNSV